MKDNNILLIRSIHDLDQGGEAHCNHALGKCFTCAKLSMGIRTAVDQAGSIFIESSFILKHCVDCRAKDNLKNL